MASEIDHRPQSQLPGPSPAKVTNDGATTLQTPGANGKPQTTTRTMSGEASGKAPPTLPSTGLVPLFPDTTNEASASDAGAGADSDSAAPRLLSRVTSPPYWPLSNINSNGGANRPQNSHSRTASAESILPAGAITLQDNEDVSSDAGNGDVYGRDRNRACWAKSVEVVSHVVVNGSATNIGAFVVWNIRVETLSGSFMNIRKRYSEFDEFRARLIETFPNFEAAVPVLPPKSVISKFRPRFLEKRRAGLQYFLK